MLLDLKSVTFEATENSKHNTYMQIYSNAFEMADHMAYSHCQERAIYADYCVQALCR